MKIMREDEKTPVKSPDVELDPDFTEAEHREFSRLEEENPYKEVEVEKIRVPKRKEYISNTRHDFLFLIIFCVVVFIFLMIVIFKPFG